MKKSNLIISGALLGSIAMTAAPISPEQALKRATGELSSLGLNSRSAVLVMEEKAGTEPGVYVFNKQDGFLVLSADDEAIPVLGYADEGTIPTNSNDLPDGFRYWISKLAERIEYLRNNPSHEGRVIPKMKRPDRAPIGVLCATRWNQDAPYNNSCPISGSGNNRRRTYTGCVATAMAQAMKYHNWPVTGEGSNSYQWTTYTLKQDFSAQTWDWANMLDVYKEGEYNDTQASAVAKIMRSCGISVDMSYSTSGSGAISMRIAPALGNFFKYDKSTISFYQRDYYGLIEWEDMIYNSLKTYGPVIYDGQSYAGGHSFICDGYDKDGYFHFNWGWGGVSDGYFLLDALDPYSQGIGGSASNSGFNFNQDVILGMQPDKSGNTASKSMNGLLVCSNAPDIDTDITYSSGENITFDFGEGMIYNIGPGTLPSGSQVGALFTTVDGNKQYVTGLGVGADGLPIMYGWHSLPLPVPANLPDGKYYLNFGFKNGDKWQAALIPLYESQHYLATVSNGKITLAKEAAVTLEGKDIEVADEMVIKEMKDSKNSYSCKVTATNPSSSPYYSNVSALLTTEEDMIGVGLRMPVDFEPNETKVIEYSSPWSQLDTSIQPGKYYYTLCAEDAMYYVPIAETEVNVVKNASGVTEVLIGEDASEAEPEYYDLQGRRVTSASDGAVVIVKRGTKFKKVVIK